MTRVIHTGDTHLGYRQYHSPERREDFLDAFRQVAADAVEMDVDAVVHAGDLFHDRRPGLPDLLGTMDVLESLSDADIPFLAVVGNHETKRDAQWLDLFEAMGLATRLGDAPVVVGETAFYGLDFVPRSQREDLEYQFAGHDADHAALVSHGLFEPLVPDYGNVEWDAREVLEAADVDFDAMLLGDEHAPTRAELGGAWVTYCGSTERASADERDDRGYNVVEFDGDVHVTRRGLETREFVFVELELAETEGFDRVRDRLREHDLEDAVVHVSLAGDGEEVSAARVESYAADRGALVARVNDRREVDEGTELEVSFTDPDEAVRERVRELGLSSAARDLDETIRASKVADSNVKDEVERRVEELLDDPSAFETAPENAGDGAGRAGSESRTSDVDADAADAAGGPDGSGAESEAASGDPGSAARTSAGTSADGPADTPAGDEPDGRSESDETDQSAQADDDAESDETTGADEPSGSAKAEEPPGADEPTELEADEPDEKDESTDADGPADTVDPDDRKGNDGGETDAEPAERPQAAGGDGQASMEDYL